MGCLPQQSGCRTHAPNLFSWKKSRLLHAWKPCVLCSHVAFLCFCLWLTYRVWDGVVLVVNVVMGWEVLIVAVTGERPTTALGSPDASLPVNTTKRSSTSS